jgi:hypothetical protein
MRAGAALLAGIAVSVAACQLTLDYDDYAFQDPLMADDPLLPMGGSSGAPPAELANGGAPSAAAGGDGAGGNPSSGGEPPVGMGGADAVSGYGGAAGGGGMSGAVEMGGGAGQDGEGQDGEGQGGEGQGGAPNPPAVVTCRGCVELVVPVDGGGRTPFQFQLPEPTDFTRGIVQWRILSLEQNPGFFIKAAVQTGFANNFSGLFHQPGIPLDRTGWTNIELDVAASNSTTAPPGTELYTAGGAGVYDKTQIVIVGVEVGAFDSFVGTGEVRILVDEVIISDVPGVATRTFATDDEGLFADVGEGLPGSEVIYHAEFVQ